MNLVYGDERVNVCYLKIHNLLFKREFTDEFEGNESP